MIRRKILLWLGILCLFPGIGSGFVLFIAIMNPEYDITTTVFGEWWLSISMFLYLYYTIAWIFFIIDGAHWKSVKRLDKEATGYHMMHREYQKAAEFLATKAKYLEELEKVENKKKK